MWESETNSFCLFSNYWLKLRRGSFNSGKPSPRLLMDRFEDFLMQASNIHDFCVFSLIITCKFSKKKSPDLKIKLRWHRSLPHSIVTILLHSTKPWLAPFAKWTETSNRNQKISVTKFFFLVQFLHSHMQMQLFRRLYTHRVVNWGFLWFLWTAFPG